jgi:hypothetical protein
MSFFWSDYQAPLQGDRRFSVNLMDAAEAAELAANAPIKSSCVREYAKSYGLLVCDREPVNDPISVQNGEGKGGPPTMRSVSQTGPSRSKT